jgi:hypothetical protein
MQVRIQRDTRAWQVQVWASFLTTVFDHPDAKRFQDRIETVTVDSVFACMQRAGLGGAPVRLQDAGT